MVILAGTGTEGAKAFYEWVREDLARRSKEELEFVLRLSTRAVSSEGAGSAGELLKAAGGTMYEAEHRDKAGIFVSASR